MSKRLTCLYFNLLAIFSVLTLLQTAWANSKDIYSTDVQIHGTVVANGTCTFNNGDAVTVDFQEVTLKGSENNTVVLEGDFIQPLNARFTCSGDTFGLLQMKMSSASGTYETYNGTQVLATDKGVVSIELLVDGEVQNMGEWFTVSQSTSPKMEVQLVQVTTVNSNNVASGDQFTASATLVMAFN